MNGILKDMGGNMEKHKCKNFFYDFTEANYKCLICNTIIDINNIIPK